MIGSESAFPKPTPWLRGRLQGTEGYFLVSGRAEAFRDTLWVQAVLGLSQRTKTEHDLHPEFVDSVFWVKGLTRAEGTRGQIHSKERSVPADPRRWVCFNPRKTRVT